jgi:PTH1 family peptidyl-tRNA hydrolase
MKLVVGLGNPGRQYLDTRHNIGYEVVDRVCGKLGWAGSGFDAAARSNFDGLVVDGLVSQPDGSSEKLVLLKPGTYMNGSGRAVQAAMAFYQLEPQDAMIVLDDLALPCGRIRIRSGGSDGGHNGLRDIERALGTGQYPRLRLGIDAPPPPMAGRDYVLGRFTGEQRRAIEPAIDRAADALLLWVASCLAATMNRYNAESTESDQTSDG